MAEGLILLLPETWCTSDDPNEVLCLHKDKGHACCDSWQHVAGRSQTVAALPLLLNLRKMAFKCYLRLLVFISDKIKHIQSLMYLMDRKEL